LNKNVSLFRLYLLATAVYAQANSASYPR